MEVAAHSASDSRQACLALSTTARVLFARPSFWTEGPLFNVSTDQSSVNCPHHREQLKNCIVSRQFLVIILHDL